MVSNNYPQRHSYIPRSWLRSQFQAVAWNCIVVYASNHTKNIDGHDSLRNRPTDPRRVQSPWSIVQPVDQLRSRKRNHVVDRINDNAIIFSRGGTNALHVEILSRFTEVSIHCFAVCFAYAVAISSSVGSCSFDQPHADETNAFSMKFIDIRSTRIQISLDNWLPPHRWEM